MGRISKIIFIFFLCSMAMGQELVERDGLVYLVNDTRYFMTCELQTNEGRVFWELYPGKASGGYLWITVLECW
jgi:hypothetical protein